jgi:hypothetical protein
MYIYIYIVCFLFDVIEILNIDTLVSDLWESNFKSKILKTIANFICQHVSQKTDVSFLLSTDQNPFATGPITDKFDYLKNNAV